jgi:hypothetical protein
MPYVPDPSEFTQPTDDRPAGSAADEFRKLKEVVAGLGGPIDTSVFGFKNLKQNIYVGASAVISADSGKAHVKKDSTAVSVTDAGLAVEFLSTIENISSLPITVSFVGAVAHNQGAEDTAGYTTWVLAQWNMLQITKVDTGRWFISGKAVPV